MKISILEGELLDYWVAQAAGLEPVYRVDKPEGLRVYVGRHYEAGELVSVQLQSFNPSNDWAHAGPIIEREQIDLAYDFGRWTARHIKQEEYTRSAESPLVAAMRAYLMWVYGDEVPDNVLPLVLG